MARPKKSPSRAEISAEKTERVRGWLNDTKSFDAIRKLFAAHYKCSPRNAEPFIKKGKAAIRDELGRTIEEHRGDSYSLYQSIASDTSLPISVRLRAREDIDNLLGTKAPVKMAPTNTAGQDLPLDTSRRLTIAELDAELSKFASDKPTESV